jgi:hypothetical protein
MIDKYIYKFFDALDYVCSFIDKLFKDTKKKKK